jgi:hypothetical protein
MSDTKPIEGGCRCGQVRFRITEPEILTMACHCRGCQRMTASAFSLSVAVPASGFAVTAGEPVIGGLHGPTQHFHCPHCMSWMFTRPEGIDWLVNVRTTMLDEPEGYEPFLETFTDEKLSWVSTPARRSFPRFPELSAYQELVQAYGAGRR